MSCRESRHSRNKSSEIRPFSSSPPKKEIKTIEINGREKIWSVVFPIDGEYIVSCGWERKIRCWRVEDGKEARTPISAGSAVRSIAVSRDGKWIVSGTADGRVTVWDAGSGEKVIEWRGHGKEVRAVDVSPDATKIATGSHDSTACIWSLITGERLLGPLKHVHNVAATKFSPDGHLIATATQWDNSTVRIYDGQTGRLLVDNLRIQVDSAFNQSLAWAGDSKQIFVLSSDGNIIRLDAFTGKTLSKWSIHCNIYPKCIALAGNGTFIAASDTSSVSFWDTTTQKRIGPVIKHTADIECMAISPKYDLVTSVGQKIILRSLCDFLPSPYCDRSMQDVQNEKVPTFKNTIQQPRNRLSDSQRIVDQEDLIRPRPVSLYGRDSSSHEKIANLEKTIQQLRHELAASQRATDEKDNSIRSLRASLRARDADSNSKIAHFGDTLQQLRTKLVDSQNKTVSIIQTLRIHEQEHQGQALPNNDLVNWATEFTNRSVSSLEIIGDEASNLEQHDEALAAYSIALSLSPSTTNLLVKWTSTVLIHGTVDKALRIATKFQLPRFVIYRAICDALEGDNRVMEAAECFRRMRDELAMDESIRDERVRWELGFQRRCTEKIEKLGDVAMDRHMYDEAAKRFSTVLLLEPVNHVDVLLKRSEARASMNSWADALSDANEAIELDPSCYRVYQMRHAALHGAGHYAEAVEAFHTMLLKLEQSPNERVRELRRQYVDATPAIRCAVKRTIRDMPRVLIDTTTGRLYDKEQQADAFETLPIYYELVSSMTRELEHARIGREVEEFYRYVMLSHKWQPGEPTFQKVEGISIYGLPRSPANNKLQMFCKLVRSLHIRWAWSDTCCVNQLDKGVQQESLVAMFRWYRGSSLTIVHLLGVLSEFQQPGDLWKSIWNTRSWTYQEYVAAQVIQFFTEDWKPYLGLTTFNHKESTTILYEMGQAMNFATRELATLRPGLDRVREKLYLASRRQTTREEDIAYSLFGIFNVAIPAIYGEGDRAVGRLLEHILTGSGDVTILAWIGRSGTYNSCLPVDLTVFDQLSPPHIPQPIEMVAMESLVTFPDLSHAAKLHDQLNGLPSPSIVASRLKLSGLVFPLAELVQASGLDPVTNLRVYRVTTSILGEVEFETVDDLTGMNDLCLVHPWIRPLLDQEFQDGGATLDNTTKAIRLIARLRQPFGALLLAPVSRAEYRRVATDSLIMAQVCGGTSLTDLIDSIRTVDIQ